MDLKLASAIALPALMCIGCGSNGNREKTQGLTTMQQAANYTPRIGVAVRTDSRVCLAIKNANLASSSPLTLVIARSPQSFTPARIKAASEEACPITKELDTTVGNYELTVPSGSDTLPKLTPMIGVVGDSNGFMQTNITVQADLDGNNQARQFRACNAPDGVHLTVWSGTPLTSPLLWHGFYYQPDNTGAGPACTPGETKAP